MSKTIAFVTITPARATKMLEAHQNVVEASGLASLNRIVNDNTVAQYAKDMRDGKWIPNGESIKVAKSGRIPDGQHRLWACVSAETPFKTALVEGIEEAEIEDVFITTDIGRAKNPGAFLAAGGMAYTNIIPAAARLIMCYNAHKSLTKKHMITTPDVVNFSRNHSERLTDSAAFVAKNTSYAPISVLGAWHYLMFEKNREDAAKFIEDLSTGAGLVKGDPVHALRERLIQSKGSRINRINSGAVFALGLNMWNDRRKGIKRQVIKSPQLDYSHLPKLV
jgi:hypothetical protein